MVNPGRASAIALAIQSSLDVGSAAGLRLPFEKPTVETAFEKFLLNFEPTVKTALEKCQEKSKENVPDSSSELETEARKNLIQCIKEEGFTLGSFSNSCQKYQSADVEGTSFWECTDSMNSNETSGAQSFGRGAGSLFVMFLLFIIIFLGC